MIVSQLKKKGRKQGSKNLVRRTPLNPRTEKRSRSIPRQDLTQEEYNVMKERLKFQIPSEAAKEPVLGTKRSLTLFLKVRRMDSFLSGRRGSSAIWDERMISHLLSKIEESPAMTLQDMLQWSSEQGYPAVASSTLHRHLDMKLVTLKVGRIIPLSRNSDGTKSSRIEYANWRSANFGRHHIYIDECGFTLWTAPRRGRAPQGQTPNIVVSSQQGKNQTVIMAISVATGMIIWRIVDGAADAKIFTNFFQEVQHYASQFQDTVCILDNCRIHDREVLSRIVAPSHELKFLPPYSPFFNPIENCFNVIKQRVRSQLVSDVIIQRARLSDIAPWGTRMEERRNILVEVITEAVKHLDQEQMLSFKMETLQFLPKVLNREDL